MENTITIPKEELKSAIRGYQGAVLNMTKERFTNFAGSLSPQAAKILLDQHRENKDFYKGVLAEEYRKEHPNSSRYNDAQNEIKKYNRQGKVLAEMIATKSQTNIKNN